MNTSPGPSSPERNPGTAVPSPRFVTTGDGVRLAYREIGQGRSLLLLHGYVSNAQVNWIRYGHAARLAAAGFRVVMPDLRAHGDSEAPHDPAHYPPDILTDDALTVIDHLGLDEFDVGGYSLGARTVVRMLARGVRPGRAVIAGMGWDGIVDPASRDGFFTRVFDGLGHHKPGSAEWRSAHFLQSTGGDPQALRLILRTSVPTEPRVLAGILTPCLVLLGDRDDDHGSGQVLADHLPAGRLAYAPGTHMSVVTRPELGQQMVRFLTARQ